MEPVPSVVKHPRPRSSSQSIASRLFAIVSCRTRDSAGSGSNDVLRAHDVFRSRLATIPHWLVALHAVSSSGPVLAASERMALRFDAEHRLVLRKLPLGGEPFPWQLYWHRRHESNPNQRWTRSLFAEVATSLDRPASRPRADARGKVLPIKTRRRKRGAPVAARRP